MENHLGEKNPIFLDHAGEEEYPSSLNHGVKHGPSNSSYLSSIAIFFQCHGYGTKSTPRFTSTFYLVIH